MKRKYPNIVIIGYRGTGKTSICQKLSQILTQFKLVNVDKEIEKEIGMSINEFIQKNDWEKFREIEIKMYEKINQEYKKETIIDCGGGMVEREENLKFLESNSNIVFWLKSPLSTIVRRLSRSSVSRPRLTDYNNLEKECEEILSKRQPLYQKYSIHSINTDDYTLVECAKEIKNYYEIVNRI